MDKCNLNLKKYIGTKIVEARPMNEIRVSMRYLSYHNENWDVDSHLSPFDFTLEEVECPQVNEVVTDFKRARKALGLKPNTCYNLSEHVPKFVSDINPKHIEALIALNELFTIAEAWNKEDEFVPDFSDCKQDKWFEYNKNVAGFVYATTGNTPTAGHTLIGSRLCFNTSERAAQFGKQFAELYNKVFL